MMPNSDPVDRPFPPIVTTLWQRVLPWRRFLGQVGLGLAVLAAIVAFAFPTRAQAVKVYPANPQLGDTISVIVQAKDSRDKPTVTLGQKTYPTFAIGGDRYRALLPTTPLDKPGQLTVQVAIGGQTQQLALQLRNRSFPTQRIWLPPGKDGDISDFEFDRVDAFKQTVSPEKLWAGPLLRPSNGDITTIYGVRRYYNGVFAQDYYHRGVDYADDVGTPIKAPAAGRVGLVGREADGFAINGNCVGLDHGQGLTSMYLHLSKIYVKPGDQVQAGQTIGALGGTGAATGPHLHWGLYVHGQSIDPVPWRTQGFE